MSTTSNEPASFGRVLVTGANGFIGTHLVALLRERGTAVRRMVFEAPGERSLRAEGAEEEPDTVYAGLDEVDAVAKAMDGCDLVYHLAGRTWAYTRAEFEHTNVRGMQNLFEAAERAHEGPRRVVCISSLMAAGPSSTVVPRSEAHRLTLGFTHYGDSKLAGERVAFAAARARDDLEVVIVRPPMVYGPGEREAINLIKTARRGLIAHPSLRLAPVSMIHVRDLVQGIVAAGERGRPLPHTGAHVLAEHEGVPEDQTIEDPCDPLGQGLYYLSDGERHDASSLARTAARQLGKRALAIRFPAPLVFFLAAVTSSLARLRDERPMLTIDKARGILSRGWWCDDRRARIELDYAPTMGLDDGVADTLRALADEEAAADRSAG